MGPITEKHRFQSRCFRCWRARPNHTEARRATDERTSRPRDLFGGVGVGLQTVAPGVRGVHPRVRRFATPRRRPDPHEARGFRGETAPLRERHPPRHRTARACGSSDFFISCLSRTAAARDASRGDHPSGWPVRQPDRHGVLETAVRRARHQQGWHLGRVRRERQRGRPQGRLLLPGGRRSLRPARASPRPGAARHQLDPALRVPQPVSTGELSSLPTEEARETTGPAATPRRTGCRRRSWT